MTKEDARKLASDKANEYKVEGYGVTEPPEVYGGPYLDDAALDPKVQFAFAGDPKEQEKWRKDLTKLRDAELKKAKKSPEARDTSDEREPTSAKKEHNKPPVKKAAASKATAKKAAPNRRTPKFDNDEQAKKQAPAKTAEKKA